MKSVNAQMRQIIVFYPINPTEGADLSGRPSKLFHNR